MHYTGEDKLSDIIIKETPNFWKLFHKVRILLTHIFRVPTEDSNCSILEFVHLSLYVINAVIVVLYGRT